MAILRILSAGAPEAAMTDCACTFEMDGRTKVHLEFATAPVIRGRLAEGAAEADIVVAPLPVLADFRATGNLTEDADALVGDIQAAVVVRSGAALPIISSIASLKQALLDATAIIFNVASSGTYIEQMIAGLGIADQTAAKTERADSAAKVMERLAAGTGAAEIGFGQATAIRIHADKGVVLVGPLPPGVENVTTYGAALLSGGAADATGDARRFLAFLATPAARRLCTAHGVTG